MRFLLFVLFTFNLVGSFAQQRCGTTVYVQSVANLQSSVPSTSTNYSRDTVNNEIITVPVVVHVLYNQSYQNISQAQILSQLKSLNDDFRRMNADAANTPAAFRNEAADVLIMFCLAQLDPRGRTTNGIIRKQTNKSYFTLNDAVKFSAAGGDDAWDSKKYLNIWVCPIQGSALGYSSIPGSTPDRDGVVIAYDAFGTTGLLRPSYNKGRTATHEVAHWLGLKHIWGDQTCGDDGVGDTPQQESYNSQCVSFPSVSSCSPDARGDMFMNFMDYTPDACMNIFTHGQKVKMRSLFSINGARNTFMSSFVCDSTLGAGEAVPPPSPSTDTTVVDSTTKSKAIDAVQVYPNPIQNQFTVKSLDSFKLSGKNIVVYNSTGKKILQLKASAELITIQSSIWSPGIYFIQIGEGSGRMTKKMIKY
jgi:hypothetical protein